MSAVGSVYIYPAREVESIENGKIVGDAGLWPGFYRSMLDNISEPIGVDRFGTEAKRELRLNYQHFNSFLSSEKSRPRSHVAIGAGQVPLAIDFAIHQQGPISVLLIDPAYDSGDLLNLSFRSWMFALQQRMNRSQNVGAFTQAVVNAGFSLAGGCWDPWSLGADFDRLTAEGLTFRDDLLEKLKQIARACEVELNFSSGSYQNCIIPSVPSVLELVHVINYLDGRALVNWIYQNRRSFPVMLFCNSDNNLPFGDEEYRHPDSISTCDFLGLLIEMGYEAVLVYTNSAKNEMSVVLTGEGPRAKPVAQVE